MRASSSPKVFPSGSVRESTKSRSNTPPNAPEAIIAGANRDPSSFVHATTSIGASVSYP